MEKAAAQQPNDAETISFSSNVTTRPATRTAAIRQLLHAVQHSRRELTLYEDLGKRYADLGRPAEAERAFTSIVEMQPNESESHTKFAELLQKQDRWKDAIGQWEQVASSRVVDAQPTGLAWKMERLAQIHEKQFEDARTTLRKVSSRTWPRSATCNMRCVAPRTKLNES